MKKLKDLLNESVEIGKVYSNPYAKSFVKEEEEERPQAEELTTEQKQAFLEAVKGYKAYGESVYRKEGLTKVYESIRGLVEVANKVTLSETGDWFDGVTVGRHMKRMNESFKVFEKTLKEVSTLQQRLESSYDEIGEVLGKYYEINETEEMEEGNEFGAARAKAIANGDSEFEVDGKTYPVKDVDKDDKENAKKFANESVLTERAEPMLSDKEQEIVRKALERAVGVGVDSEPDDTRYHGGNSNFAFDGGEDLMMYVGKYADEDKPYYVSIEGFDAGKVSDDDAKDFKGIVKAAMQMAKKYKKRLTTESKSMKLTDMIKKPSVNEGKHDAILDKLADIVKGAKSFMDIGKELKSNGIKYSFGTNMIPMYIIDKPVKIAILNKKYADGAEREVGSTAIGLMESVKMNEAKYDIGMARKGNGLTVYNKAEEENGDYKNVAHIDNKGKIKYYDKKLPSKIKKEIEAEAKKMMEVKTEGTMKLKNLLKESFGMGELPSSKLLKMEVSAKDMLESVGEDDVNEARVSAKKLLQSVVKGETDRVEGIKMSKEMAQSFLDWQRLSPYGKKYGTLPFNRLFTAAFSFGLNRYADKKSKEYKELEAKANQMFKARRGESVNEGASTEEKRIVMLAVRKIAKYRNVPIEQSVVDVWRAAEELERDIKKGKVKK